jgi:hypothetical protein
VSGEEKSYGNPGNTDRRGRLSTISFLFRPARFAKTEISSQIKIELGRLVQGALQYSGFPFRKHSLVNHVLRCVVIKLFLHPVLVSLRSLRLIYTSNFECVFVLSFDIVFFKIRIACLSSNYIGIRNAFSRTKGT